MMSSLLNNLSSFYRNVLNTYHKSEKYKRELALNILSPIISVSSQSKYFKLGVYGVERKISEENEKVYDIYCDLKYLFSEDYHEFISDSSFKSQIYYNFNLILISNINNLRDLSIDYHDYLKFDEELDLSHITLNFVGGINRDDILKLYSLNTNYTFYDFSYFSVLLHDNVPVNLEEDRELLLFLDKIIPKNEMIHIKLIFNQCYSVYYLNKLFMGFDIFERCFKFSFFGFNGPFFNFDKSCLNSPFKMYVDPLSCIGIEYLIVDG